MYFFLKWIYQALAQFGLNLIQFSRAWAGLPFFLRNYFAFRRQRRKEPADFAWGRVYPCLGDRFTSSDAVDRHYFHQDLWMAQRICRNQPARHVDIGSRLDGFVTHLASFREVEVWDLRPTKIHARNIVFRQVDLLQPAPELANQIGSVSCLSVLEHLGLGRYGDRVAYRGYLTGWNNIYALLAPGGKFYFSVPIGEQRVEFDAHRVFSVSTLLAWMAGKYRVDSLAYINDAGELIEPAARNPELEAKNFHCHFGCGLFELTKL